MVFFEGNQLFAGDFHALLDEINAGMLQFSKKWNWYGLPNIKGTFGHGASKGCRKTNQRWIMYVANSTILELPTSTGRYHFRLRVFASTGEYFYCWHWRVLPKVLQGKWCQDLQKPCSIILSLTSWKVSVFGVILVRIRSESGKIRTRITPNTDTTHAVLCAHKLYVCIMEIGSFNWCL